MVYQWKLDKMYPVPAQTAGEELSRIYRERGELQAADVVEESRPENAPLHPCFEWDDWKAAEKYREEQARGIIQCVVAVQDTANRGPMEVRAFVHVEDSYRPTEIVVSEAELKAAYIADALRYVEAFQRRLETFSDLRPVHTLSKAVGRTVRQLQDIRRPTV